MFQIVEYSYHELICLLEHAKEISQENNINANSKLYVLDNETVIKIFLPESKDSLSNINNLLLLKEQECLEKIEELVLPTELIKLNKNIIGYIMPYIEGKTLSDCLLDSSIEDRKKLEIFTQLAKIVNQLPAGIHIGDLHANNVIVDHNFKIYLVDIDGFSIDIGEKLSVPTPLPNVFEKYYTYEGEPIVSKNSDIYCIFRLFMQSILKGIDILESEYRDIYISYLKRIEGAQMLAKELELLHAIEDNVLEEGTFSLLPLNKISISCFLIEMGLLEENKVAELTLKGVWRRR